MKGIYSWTLAVIITLAAVFLQRNTGPSHPGKQLMEVMNQHNGQILQHFLKEYLIKKDL